MKCFYKLFILIFCFGAVPFLQGQTPLKQMNSTVHISKIFAVPPDINLEEELNSFDLSRMIWEERSFTTKMVINQDHKLTITTLYPQQPRYDRDYEFNIGMSISDENNAILYDHSGELLHSIEHDTSLSEFSIHPDSVDFFAMVNLFDQDLIDLSAWYEQNDF